MYLVVILSLLCRYYVIAHLINDINQADRPQQPGQSSGSSCHSTAVSNGCRLPNLDSKGWSRRESLTLVADSSPLDISQCGEVGVVWMPMMSLHFQTIVQGDKTMSIAKVHDRRI
jgi:hypothetical protein